MCIGELKCKGSYGHFVFKPIDMIKMMAVGQSRLARRTQIEEEELPSYDSPVTSPSNFRITKNSFLSSRLTKNTIVNTFENNYEKCSICMQDISNNSKTLICNHVYHRNCINTWLFNANTCPICRRIIQEENVTTTTTFNVPDFKDRVALGKGTNNGTVAAAQGSMAASSKITTDSGTAQLSASTTTVAASAKDSSTVSVVSGVTAGGHTHTATIPTLCINYIIKT